MPTDKDDKDTQETAGEPEQTAGAADGQADEGSTAQQPESSLPQTQDELDKLIARRIKKERRAWEKEKSAEGGGTGSDGDSSADDTLRAENASLRAELLEARAQSEAAKMGFRAEAAEDAVYLAMRIANKDSGGEPDADDIKSALSDVLKKHPEWRSDSGSSSGFRVGAPSPQQSENKPKTPAQKRWNRFN